MGSMDRKLSPPPLDDQRPDRAKTGNGHADKQNKKKKTEAKIATCRENVDEEEMSKEMLNRCRKNVERNVERTLNVENVEENVERTLNVENVEENVERAEATRSRKGIKEI